MYTDTHTDCFVHMYVNVIQQKSPTFPPKIPRFLKNKPCISVKEPYISVKEPNMCADLNFKRRVYTSCGGLRPQPYVSAKGPYISAKEPNIRIKSAKESMTCITM